MFQAWLVKMAKTLNSAPRTRPGASDMKNTTVTEMKPRIGTDCRISRSGHENEPGPAGLGRPGGVGEGEDQRQSQRRQHAQRGARCIFRQMGGIERYRMGLQHAQRLTHIPARSRQKGQEAQDQQGSEEVPAAWNSTLAATDKARAPSWAALFRRARSRWNGPGSVGPSTQRKDIFPRLPCSAMPSPINERMRKKPPALPSKHAEPRSKHGWTCVCTPNGPDAGTGLRAAL